MSREPKPSAMMIQEESSCRVCGCRNALQRCSKCKQAFYCSQTHQQSDWKSHRSECKNFCKILQEIPATAANNNNNNYNSIEKLDCAGANCLTATVKQNGTKDSLAYAYENEDNSCSAAVEEAAETKDVDEAAVVQNSVGSDEEREKHRRQFRNLSENTMQISDENLFNSSLLPGEMRYEELCTTIINDLNMYGLSVIDDFLGKQKGLEILNEVHYMYSAGLFKNGQLVSNVADRDLKTIRGDKITWVKGDEPGCKNIDYLVNQIDSVVISANRMKNNGSLGKYQIKERTKAMVACYPGNGTQYVMHVDNPNKDGRVITAIYYLNLNWESPKSGGILKICPEQSSSVANIDPKFDRIIFFWSDRRNPHAVQPAHRTRYAITVWYFDADEREKALNNYNSLTDFYDN